MKFKRILQIGGMFALVGFTLFQGFPIYHEEMPQECIKPFQNNIDYPENSLNCNTIPVQLNLDGEYLLSGSHTSSGAILSGSKVVI